MQLLIKRYNLLPRDLGKPVMKGDLSENPLRRAVSTAIKSGYQLNQEAFDFLKGLAQTVDPERLIKSVVLEMEKLEERPTFIDSNILEGEARKMLRSRQEKVAATTTETGKVVFHPYAKDIDADLRVIEDPTAEVQSTGTLEDYVEYFRDRYRRMSRLLTQRMDVESAIPLSEALRFSKGKSAKIICMISGKRETRRGIILTVEDLEDTATVYVPADQRGAVIEKAKALMLDQVVCISVIKGRNALLIAEDVLFPDIPSRKPRKASIPVYAALISDLHVGSKMFMKNEFERFIRWLKGKLGGEGASQIASHVKYLIIAGDVVDGVGIYPQQMDELYIKDLYKQYETAAEILQDVPDYIEIIVIPGNHDASRRALPQPAIERGYAEPMYEGRKIYSLGDPSMISLHGVNMLLYHGRSLDDVISLVPNMSFKEPDKAMTFLLRSRHLVPTYGARTTIAPEKKDHMIIENIPDVFHAGHVHMMSYSGYRGVLVVNSGAWQDQTEYQREMGHMPNPCISPIVNLETLEVMPIDFRTLS